MTSVLGYSRTFFTGGEYWPESLGTLDQELERFHAMLESLGAHFTTGEFSRMSPERLLQGPLSDAMSHVGQLAMLRRLFDSPVPPENFIMTDVDAHNLSANQPPPAAPDDEWHTPAGPQQETL